MGRNVPVFVADPADERKHQNDGSPYWTETSYWGWADPASGLNGWIYLYARPVLGVISAGVWVYGGTDSTAPYDQPYHRHYFQLPFTEDDDLNDLALDTGLRIETISAFGEHRITYRSADEIELDLTFTARSEARLLTPPSSPQGHLDQLLLVSGTLMLPDIGTVEIEGGAARDRTWSPRSDIDGSFKTHKDDYAWGVTADGASFLSATVLNTDGTQMMSFGHLLDVGGQATRQIASVHRQVPQRSDEGLPVVIELAITDENGEVTPVRGDVESTVLLTTFPGSLTMASRVRWVLDGKVLFGEDQEKWPSRLLSPIGRDITGPGGGPQNDWMARPE